MAAFDLGDRATDRAFQLAKLGPAHLFDDLGDLPAWLAERGYRVIGLDAAAWTTRADFHRDVKAALDFPAHYGDNLDAFNDCMRDVATDDHGATGTVLAFTGYDSFVRHEPRAAQVVVDIIAEQSRFAMLFGHRLLCLLQSNDPDLRLKPVGATAVEWHHA